MPVKELYKTRAKYNPRQISEDNLQRLMTSLKIHRQVENLIYNKRTKTLISGHQRLEAAKRLGWKTLDVNVLDISEAVERALNIALNNPNLQGEWDLPKLVDTLEWVLDKGETEISLEGTGFDLEDLERLKIEAFGDPDKEQKDLDEDLVTTNKCPKCGYEW